MAAAIRLGDFHVGQGYPLALVAGPCVIESEKLVLSTCEKIKEVTSRHEVPFVFKSSYTKANRLKIDSYSGPGLEDGLDGSVDGDFLVVAGSLATDGVIRRQNPPGHFVRYSFRLAEARP